MRLLLNNGLTPENLYTGVSKKIVGNKGKRWFKNYGTPKTTAESLATIFKYAWVLIMNRVIDEKKRFRFPTVARCYIDFDTVADDNFVEQRQLGRFQDIDFINSEFTGYGMNVYYRGKLDHLFKRKLYVGGSLKKRFIEKINAGEKFYSIEDLNMNDILPDILKKFEGLTENQIKKVLRIGFSRMLHCLKIGCSMLINSTVYFTDCYVYIGDIYVNKTKQKINYSYTRDRKLRKLEIWKNSDIRSNSIWYLGLYEADFEKFCENNKTAKNTLFFTRVLARKIQKEWYYKGNKIYIFKVESKPKKNWVLEFINKKFRNPEYVGVVERITFTPATQTWKELIKEYATRSN